MVKGQFSARLRAHINTIHKAANWLNTHLFTITESHCFVIKSITHQFFNCIYVIYLQFAEHMLKYSSIVVIKLGTFVVSLAILQMKV